MKSWNLLVLNPPRQSRHDCDIPANTGKLVVLHHAKGALHDEK